MNRRFVPILLLAAALLLFTIGVASADLKALAPPSSWDDAQARWQNSNIIMHLDGQLQPFFAPLSFDTDPHPNACGTASTQWAGDAEIGLYHTDNDPVNGQGFVSTSNWSLLPCSVLNAKGAPKYPPAGSIMATCDPATPACQLIGAPDQILTCSTGNCADEIATDFNINLDTDCNGEIDPAFAAAGDMCLYWTAVKPPFSPVFWGGPLQVRYGTQIGGGTGDKTLTFNFTGPNAVSLSSVKAVAEANTGSLAVWAAGMFLAAAALFVWRRGRA